MISDFGLSKMEDSGIMATACGTPGLCDTLSHDFYHNSMANFRLRRTRSPRTEAVWQSGRCVVHRCYLIHFAVRLSSVLR